MLAPSFVRPVGAVVVGCLATAALVWVGTAGAAGANCVDTWGAQPRNVGPYDNVLTGVAETGGCAVLAVGYYNNAAGSQTLIERWSGRAWSIEPSPNPGGSSGTNFLNGVTATSATNAWAVGDYYNGTADQTLIEHWNGKVWKVQPSPDPGGPGNGGQLNDVSAISATDAWAVGYYSNGTSTQTLIEHWNGKVWKVQSSPSFARSRRVNGRFIRLQIPVLLSGVVAVSSSDAWAVGHRDNGTALETLIEHWNGKRWTIQRSVNPGGSTNTNALAGVTATSADNAWAVGNYFNSSSGPDLTLVEHFNGKSWKVQSSPSPGGTNSSYLYGVAATSANKAWAVGETGESVSAPSAPPLVEGFSGKAWKVQQALNLGESGLYDVAAGSPNDVWAVGFYYNGATDRALALHAG